MEDDILKIEVIKLRKTLDNLKLDAKLERHDNHVAAEILLKFLKKSLFQISRLHF